MTCYKKAIIPGFSTQQAPSGYVLLALLVKEVPIYFQNMSSLLENITAIIDLFHQYSKTDKETETLSKKELKELLEVEFRPILKNPDDPDTADVFMHILDIDHDKKIDFTEFFLMVFKLAQAYYNSTRRQNFHTSGQKQKKYRHHHEDEEDVIEEEDKEEKKRKSSHSTSSDGKEKDRSKSPRGRGRNRHGSHSGSGGRRGVRVTSGHTHGYAKKSRGENIRRSSSTELKERSRNLSVSPNTGYEGNEDEYHYEKKSTVRAKSGPPRYVDSYQESEETIDTTTDFQLEKQRNRRTPDIKSKEKITFIERNINDTIKDSKIRYENPSPPLTNIRNEGYTTSEDTDSEGRSEDSHSYHQSASENKNEHEENTSHSQDQREFSRGRDSVHTESRNSAAHRQGRRHEQERDSSRHSRTEHGQTSDVFGSRTRRESSVSPASDSERSEQDGGRQAVTTQGRSGSTSRHQQEGSHSQARVSSRHSDSQQGHRATPRERDSVHAESGSSAAHRQGRRHEQERDSSRHSRTEHGQTSDVFGSRTRRESSVSPASDSERSEQDGGRQASPEAALPTDRGAAMSRNETAPDTHGLSTDKPQMCPVAVDAGNPLSARPATASAPSKMEGDKL
ncbi:uncharacterized protein LOC105068264 [Camelus bactrianus]|uniref:Uncharacterized protein LOC105068264 n=1 Tax=Camelus bactrianus TaxID=9837 RepID=A0AC58P7R5_CAMBA